MIPLDDEFRIGLEPWMDRAKCKGRPTEDYDIDNLPSPLLVANRRQAAAQLCQKCPVFAECAWYAYRYRIVGWVMAGIPVKLQRNEQHRAQLLGIAARAGIADAQKELSKGAA
ncbi:WhiB family transcriptional regulator [Nocardia jiangxiensis]|uniref:WhiB family transcriptional regulator n=1 Tax=Nocardia jiangxiensis TaxID=282685 RepID=UPI0002FB11DB|nr:WhiB family transcriptional regulator [Nocardia jiangxiensis]